ASYLLADGLFHRRLSEVGADGVHVTEGGIKAIRAAVSALKPDGIVGVGNVRTRHDAMSFGELDVDYVMFGPLGGAPDPHARPALDDADRRAALRRDAPDVGPADRRARARRRTRAGTRTRRAPRPARAPGLTHRSRGVRDVSRSRRRGPAVGRRRPSAGPRRKRR
ncbi:MAG: thiamine phosphate synthase, partial [Cellulosimicrobium funkei]